MNTKKTIYLTILILLGMIALPTIYKVVKNHNDKLELVTEKEFLYQAKYCYRAEECLDNKVTLQDLYDHHYLTEELYNPISKKYYATDSYVLIKEEKIVFKY